MTNREESRKALKAAAAAQRRRRADPNENYATMIARAAGASLIQNLDDDSSLSPEEPETPPSEG